MMSLSARFAAVLFACVVLQNGVNCFAPHHRALGKVAHSRVQAPLQAAPLAYAAGVPIMYSLMSFSEYITHRYYQHADYNRNRLMQAVASMLLRNGGKGHKVRGGGHVEHHAETLDDMSLKSDERWAKSPAAKSLDADPYRGTAFTWTVTGLMFLQLLVTCVPVMSLLGFTPLATVGWIVPSLAIHTLVWNALHPAMHGLPDISITEGPPASLLARFRSSKLFRFLELNHVGHHVVGGVGNYNVCCPGCDNVFGTYVTAESWKAKVDPQFASVYA